jgi:adenine-specific DNA methylase
MCCHLNYSAVLDSGCRVTQGSRKKESPMSAPSTIDSVLAQVDQNLDQSLQRLYELLRIKSISTDPAYADQCQRAADWIVGDWRRSASTPPPARPPAIP